MALTSLATVQKFFEMDSATFRKEWTQLTDQDRADIRMAFNDGTMTY